MLKTITLKGEQKKVLFLPATNPIQIKGVAGSGKTTVSLYRAKHLLETQSNLFQEANIVIFTFNKTLVAYIEAILPYIYGGYQKESDELITMIPDGLNIQVINFHKWAYSFIGLQPGKTLGWSEQIRVIDNLKIRLDSNLSNILQKSSEFFLEEISWIKGKLISTKEEYLNIQRTGRGKTDRVTQDDKDRIWGLYLKYEEELSVRGKVDFDDYARISLKKIEDTPNWIPPYTHIIIDEAQDLNKAQILTISKLVSEETKSLTIIADAAQRIYKSGFNWMEVGLNVRGGRTVELKRNYRNSVHIARAALSLLSKEEDQSEFTKGMTARKGGEKPKVGYFKCYKEQLSYLNDELSKLYDDDQAMGTVVLHRTNEGISSIKNYLSSCGHIVESIKSKNSVNYGSDSVKLCTMSSIKGLEFNNVFILDLADDVIPFPPGFIDKDDEYHISTERRLLYTCLTRARNRLYLLCDQDNPSRYIKEIGADSYDIITMEDDNDFNEDDLPW